MATTVDEIQVLLDVDSTQMTTGLATAQAKLQTASRKMASVARTMGRAVSLPIALIGGASVKAFADFDSAMNESLAIMGDVSDSMRQDMANAAKQVATETTIGAEQAAESYFFLASAGLDAKQSIEALPQVARFAQAGMFDMKRATDLATDAQSALGLKSQDAQENLKNLKRVTDVFVKANQQANASVEQFATAMTRKAGNALSKMNISVEEGTAVLAAFADQGIKGNRAGTVLARTLNKLAKTAQENAEEYEKLGIQVFDASGNMRSFSDIARDFETSLGNMTPEARSAAFANLELTRTAREGIKALIGQSDAIEGYRENLEEAGGATQEVADNQLQSFSSQMDLLKNRLELAGIELGQAFIPVIRNLASLVSNLVKSFRALNEETKTQIAQWSAVAFAIAPVAFILSKILAFAGGIAGAMKSAALAIGSMSGPVAAVVAAVATVASAAFLVIRNWKEVVRFFRRMWAILIELHQEAGKLIILPFKGAAQKLVEHMVLALDAIVTKARQVMEAMPDFAIRDTWVAQVRVAEKLTGKALEKMRDKTDKTQHDIAQAWRNVKHLGSAALSEFGRAAIGTAGAIKEEWNNVMGFIQRQWGRLQSMFEGGIPGRGGGGGTEEGEPPVQGRGPEQVESGQSVEEMVRNVQRAGASLQVLRQRTNVARRAWERMQEGSLNAMDAVKGAVQSLTNSLSLAIQRAGSLGQAFRQMGRVILNVLTGMISKMAIAAALAAIISNVGGGFGGALGLGEGFKNVMSSLVGLQEGGITTGKTPAMLHGNEAVIPLDRMEEMMPRGGKQRIDIVPHALPGGDIGWAVRENERRRGRLGLTRP